MPDNPNEIDKHELELWKTIDKLHNNSIPYETIHHLLEAYELARPVKDETLANLETMAYAEGWAVENAITPP
jgi:Ser/Thr protein kinase RdoA (MazF antagonist)